MSKRSEGIGNRSSDATSGRTRVAAPRLANTRHIRQQSPAPVDRLGVGDAHEQLSSVLPLHRQPRSPHLVRGRRLRPALGGSGCGPFRLHHRRRFRLRANRFAWIMDFTGSEDDRIARSFINPTRGERAIRSSSLMSRVAGSEPGSVVVLDLWRPEPSVRQHRSAQEG
jgi:hypothetical protein